MISNLPTKAFKTVAPASDVQVILFMDITGTMTDDEPTMRQGWENVCKQMEMPEAVDWPRWHGIGDQAIFDNLVERNFINNDNIDGLLTLLDLRSQIQGISEGKHKDFLPDLSGMTALPEKLKKLFSAVEARLTGSYMNSILTGGLELRPGIEGIFNTCAYASVPVIPVTNDSDRVLAHKKHSLKLYTNGGIYNRPRNFSFMISPHDADGARKPDPKIYIKAMERCIAEHPDKKLIFVAIEDSEPGLKAARLAAASLVGIDEGRHRMMDFIQYKFEKNSPQSQYASAVVWEDTVERVVLNTLAMRMEAPSFPAPLPGSVLFEKGLIARP